uniref:Putative ataq protein n=1 Tax=Amblyomma triste TaxID=251400 RepID=A0A023G898_AMBTT
MGKQCVFEERKAKCKCSGDKIDVNGACTANCTAEKIKECTGMMSTCKIADNAQICTCKEPLTWDSAKKVCVLEKQYRYVFTFKQLQYDAQDRCADWRRGDLAAAIEKAMKNLYGEDLSASRLIECGEERQVELTFKTEPLSPSLNRIHQCENKEDNSCLFAPHLRIIDGSVTGPTPVDLCTEFFTKIPAVSANNLKCRKREDGGYSLRCAQGNTKASEMYGALTVELCDDSKPGNGAASVSAAFLLGVLIPVTIAQCGL